MDWDDRKKSINQRKQAHLRASEDVFDEAAGLAHANLCLLLRMPAGYHYQLICYNGSGGEYIYNLYPSTQRIYSDPKHRGLFLKVKKPWTLLDVVKAAVKK